MATHAIGRNNEMVGICIDRQAKALLGRAATEDDRSLAAFILHHALENLKAVKPTLAQQIQAIKEERLRLRQGILLLFIGLLAIGTATELRRSPRGRRVEQEEIA